MKRYYIFLIVVSFFWLSCAAVAYSTEYTITTINIPGSIFTYAHGIDDSGQIVGQCQLGTRHFGFVYSGGSFTTLEVPGGGYPPGVNYSYTEAWGINNSGQVVGYYADAQLNNYGSNVHSFLFKGGTYTTLPALGPYGSSANGINDRGQIVGYYSDSSPDQNQHGYLLSGGAYTLLDVPGAVYTIPRGINNKGQVVGYFSTGGAIESFL